MRHTLTFLDTQYAQLTAHLFAQGRGRGERAAYLLCGLSQTETELRLLVRRVIAVPDADLLSQSGRHLSIPARSFLPVLKQADSENAAFVFVHSHPEDVPDHSDQDDREEPGLFRTAYNRIGTAGAVHGSIVLSRPDLPKGRIWLDGGGTAPIDMIKVIGRRLRFFPKGGFDVRAAIDFHDRQVRAFGPDIVPLLRGLTIGVAGAGGTGSAVIEQLIRLGVGHLILADGKKLDRSNISRVYGSEVSDVGISKAVLMSRLARHIGLGTEVEVVEKPITYQSAMKRFCNCDAIFGCTDDQWGRALLSQLSLQYCVPIFDLGVKIDSQGGTIRSIAGRVTTLMPGLRCLYCHGQITAEGVAAEAMQALSPEEAAGQQREGYIPELPEAEPAVITFTTATAALAVAELLHRIIGYRGESSEGSEVLIRFDEGVIRKPGCNPRPGCFCRNQSLIARGDQPRFLGQTWRPE